MKKRTSFPRFFTAAAMILSILAGALLVSCAGNKKEPVVPPMRMAEYPADSSLGNVPGTVQEAIERSDAVAMVRVGDWLGETTDKLTTLFNAEVIETIKGELPAKFTLLQGGSSEFTYRDYPLFTYGNELFLFLTKISDENREFLKFPENTYKITGTYTSVMHLIELDGEKYVIPRDYALLENMPESVKNLAKDEAFLKRAVDELKRSDSVLSKVNIAYAHVYKLDELVSMVKAG
ncbi:MAG: hypothetical protein II871_00615 [Clostridia bacterium]|nr:hypothetical protein [Clostridia bacterium]